MIRASLASRAIDKLREDGPIELTRSAYNYTRDEYRQRWIARYVQRHAVPADDYLQELDQELWRETQDYCERVEGELYDTFEGLHTVDFSESSGVGGGAAYDVLYFFLRNRKPETVVETGVSAGWSSRVILDALDHNSKGQLYSNDLPYAERPTKQGEVVLDTDEIGILVDDDLKDRWELSLGPDRQNLPDIVSSVDSIDVFHYDSDKSYEGSQFAMECVRPKLHDESLVIIDDVYHHRTFRELAERADTNAVVLSSARRSKEIGVIQGSWGDETALE